LNESADLGNYRGNRSPSKSEGALERKLGMKLFSEVQAASGLSLESLLLCARMRAHAHAALDHQSRLSRDRDFRQLGERLTASRKRV
jgi:hypothetical protein